MDFDSSRLVDTRDQGVPWRPHRAVLYREVLVERGMIACMMLVVGGGRPNTRWGGAFLQCHRGPWNWAQAGVDPFRKSKLQKKEPKNANFAKKNRSYDLKFGLVSPLSPSPSQFRPFFVFQIQ